MKKISVKIVGLSYSQSQIGSYVAVLSEIKGSRKIPVIVKPSDAQYIAVKMESISHSLPMIHDLFRKVIETLSARILHVIIYELIEGVFYCKIILQNEAFVNFELECGVGDAIALSLTFNCKLYVSDKVMKMAGISMSDEPETQDTDDSSSAEDDVISVDSLEKMLADALENEEYEIASQLRDKINEMKEKK